jgi:hypothetical protein
MRRVHALPAVALALLTLAALLAAPVARAQCREDWLPASGFAGFNGSPVAGVRWDPDGAGPEPERLVVGGSFSGVNDQPIEGVALWDGQRWRALTDAVASPLRPRFVRALTLHEGRLISASGSSNPLETSIPREVLEFDGRAWRRLGQPFPGRVNALLSAQGTLYAAGEVVVSNQPRGSVFRWTGQDWQPVGPEFNNEVRALAFFAGRLIAGGAFTDVGGSGARFVAAWDGASWASIGNRVDGPVNLLFPFQQVLVLGGPLIYDFPGGGVSNGVAFWDGQNWSAPDRGTLAGFSAPTTATTLDGDLVIGPVRLFDASGTLRTWAGRLVNGSWQLLSQDVLPRDSTSQFSTAPSLLLAGPEGLFVGGALRLQGGLISSGAFLRNGAWTPLGDGFFGRIRDVVTIGDEIFAVGDMETLPGGVPARGVGAFDGQRWRALGDPGSLSYDRVGVWQGRPVVASWRFSPLPVLAWDGAAWQPLTGAPAPVFRVLDSVEFEGELVIAGDLFLGGSRVGVAAWNGQSWRPLGTNAVALGVGGGAVSLAVYNGELVVGGALFIGGEVGVAVLRDNAWQPLGTPGIPTSPINGSVNALTVFNGDLIAGGFFFRAASAQGPQLQSIARWNGGAWAPMDEGAFVSAFSSVQADLGVRDFEVFNGRLYAFGAIGPTQGAPNNSPYGAMVWDGQRWQTLNGGPLQIFTRPLNAGAALGDTLAIVGPDVNSLNGAPYAGWALWGCAVPCRADLNEDGELTFDDLQLFVGLWTTTSPRVDFTRDGEVTFEDVQAFVAIFNAGF